MASRNEGDLADDLHSAEAEDRERQRIAFLLQRDGPEVTGEWVQRTRVIYRQALLDKESYASQPRHRPDFEAAIKVYEQFLSGESSRTTG